MAGAQETTSKRANPQMQAVLEQLLALGAKPVHTLLVSQARTGPTPADAVKALLKKQGKSAAPEPVGKVENRTIEGPGGEIPIRIYTPKGNGPFPLVVYYHGGGWVIANLDTYDASARTLTNAGNAIVVSSHYRQAPEHKFPAAHQDAFAAYRWALQNARSLNADRARVAVAGESAGGNLAAAVSMMARDSSVKLPVHQLLVYPIARYGWDTESYQENAKAVPLGRADMRWFFDHY
ncbi:MAG: alpha/beta hydrolase, partial [Gemmatimonadales bacterium]|nr:alpha/beta hydrolase [Gemmatimonadales bacterium]